MHYLHIADLHFGHLKVTADEIFHKLTKYLYPHLKDCKGIFFNGDFLDQLITMDNKGIRYVLLFMKHILDQAQEYGYFIRVLRGTLGHDRHQLKMFETLASEYPNINFKYHDAVNVETVNNLNLLFLPDNLTSGFENADKVLEHVHDLMRTNKITKFDFVCGHGYFEHVLPGKAKKHTRILYTEEMFKDIVSGFVVMGHVHTHSAYKNIVYSGSFDRLVHGEEESKGFLKITKKDNKYKCIFVENKEAAIFRTISIEKFNTDVEEIISYLKVQLSDLEEWYSTFRYKSNVRLVMNNKDTYVELWSKLPFIFPHMRFSVKFTDSITDEDFDLNRELDLIMPKVEEINNDDVASLILNFLKQKKGQTFLTLELIEDYLKKL